MINVQISRIINSRANWTVKDNRSFMARSCTIGIKVVDIEQKMKQNR